MIQEKKGKVVARGKRVLEFTCIGYVITRFMKEANLTYRELFEHTGISKSTLHGWTCGVVMENPDVLIVLKREFSKIFNREISTDELLFGKDEDREAMKNKIIALEKTIQEQSKQLALFDLSSRSA